MELEAIVRKNIKTLVERTFQTEDREILFGYTCMIQALEACLISAGLEV